MVSPDTLKANTLAAYDAIAPLYEEYSDKYTKYLNQIDNLVIHRLQPGMRLLDLGSGDGRRLKKITGAARITDVVSVEPSGEMAALCRTTTGFPVHQLFGDALDQLPESGFDAATALWNVFGHMPGSALRLATLKHLKAKLKPGGLLMLDVNNRHNQLAYGRWNVLKRRAIDAIAFDETRGDAHYEWKIAGQSFPASGHLFTPAEIEKLFTSAGFAIAERCSVNYATGQISTSPHNGQLFYKLTT